MKTILKISTKITVLKWVIKQPQNSDYKVAPSATIKRMLKKLGCKSHSLTTFGRDVHIDFK